MLDIFNEHDPSGKLSKESYLLKSYPEVYNYISDYCKINNLIEIPFKERVYLAINKMKNRPTCKNPNCQNFTKFINSTLGHRDYCSNKCISSDPNIIKLKEENSLRKWGTKSPVQSEEVKEKVKTTNNLRYGGNSPTSSDKVREKVRNTVMEKWGVENVAQNSDIKKIRIDSFKNSKFLENFRKSSMEKWGVDHPWKNKDVHNKSVLSAKSSRNHLVKDIVLSKLSELGQYELVEIEYDQIKRNIKIFCNTCGEIFHINRENFHIRYKNKTTICTICNPKLDSRSGQEMELVNFIKQNYGGDIKVNTKGVIPPQEIDIFLPELKLAFEYNGLYWHSESEKGKWYHHKKTQRCCDQGIDLVHIWEDDWVYKNDIIKSIIRNKLGKIGTKIGARTCEVKEIDDLVSRKFLHENHILGEIKSKVRLGLFFEDELVSLMTFSRSGGDFVLSRFCNKLGFIVAGSASKLFSWFVKNYNPNSIISYSDESMYSGDVYKKLGFQLSGYSQINYKWVVSGRRFHKDRFRKSRLQKMGYDIQKTEDSIMYEEVGAFKVWDCGLKRWVYKTNSPPII